MGYDKLEEFPIGEVLIDARKDEHGFVTLRFEDGTNVIFPPGLGRTGPTVTRRVPKTLAQVVASYEATCAESGRRRLSPPAHLYVSPEWGKFLKRIADHSTAEAQRLKDVSVTIDQHEPEFRWGW